jgi:hypothetical protein
VSGSYDSMPRHWEFVIGHLLMGAGPLGMPSMKNASSQEAKVPCPGCGGRGFFEWPANPKVPKRWAPTAACGMCQGTGKVPSSWLRSGKTGG